MPLRDVIAAALSRPAGKVVDGPVRDIINEILAERGYASPAEVAALRDEADALRAQLAALQASVASVTEQLGAIQSQVTELQARPVPAPAPAAAPAAEGLDHSLLAPTIPAAPETPLSERAASVDAAVAAGQCKVPGCAESPHRDGFCTAHAEAWRAGRLPGFVSPEGLVSVSGQPRQIAPDHAGAVYAIKDGQVRIGEHSVPSVAY